MFIELHYRDSQSEYQNKRSEMPAAVRYLIGIITAGLSAALIFALSISGKAAPTIATLAAEKLPLSGVENPVTAVLLNFRSYDTLLEVAVLLIVTVAILPRFSSSSAVIEKPWLTMDTNTPIHSVLSGLLIWLVPLAILIGGYLLWTGAYRPGGAFQAGAVIAGAGVALSLAGRHRFSWEGKGSHLALCFGLLVFIVVAALNAFITGTTLQYPSNYAGLLILAVEIAATLSIAATLLLLFNRLQTMGHFSEGEPAQ